MESWEKQCMLGQLLWRMHKPKPANQEKTKEKKKHFNKNMNIIHNHPFSHKSDNFLF